MPTGHISGFPGLDRKGQANQFGLHVVEARGFSVKCKGPGVLQPLHPAAQVLKVQHGGVGHRRVRGAGYVELVAPRLESEAVEQFEQPLGFGGSGLGMVDQVVQVEIHANGGQLPR